MAQEATEIYDPKTAAAFGLHPGQVAVGIHCGSRGLGHKIGTEFFRDMVIEAERTGFCRFRRQTDQRGPSWYEAPNGAGVTQVAGATQRSPCRSVKNNKAFS